MSGRYIIAVCFGLSTVNASAQKEFYVIDSEPDSLRTVSIEEVKVAGDLGRLRNFESTLDLDVAGERLLSEKFTGNLVQTLQNIPGVRSMDIGAGFSKPVIRGMGFNRIAVVNNGVKQEGQQWGADHGLETDSFDAVEVIIRKGPSSLLYGSDAMGGAIEIRSYYIPPADTFHGEAVVVWKSVNGTAGGSVMGGVRKNRWYVRGRYSHINYGDYRIPKDTVEYLTRKIPVYGRRLKNTAGREHDGSIGINYLRERYRMSLDISDSFQKNGFFPGAHGMPDLARVQDDGNRRNIELPYSSVNHFRASLKQMFDLRTVRLDWTIAYQNNRRREMSLFHTHYSNQNPPVTNPDRELGFDLDTYGSSLTARMALSEKLTLQTGLDFQYQNNRISGYSFLLPEYRRTTTGVFAVADFRISPDLLLSGGIRFDHGKLVADQFTDPYLFDYMTGHGYDDQTAAENMVRSYPIDRSFSNFSGSMGLVWRISDQSLFKANAGRSFRLPAVNELASNGVHHGTFRHEKGDPNLKPERGWQVDAAYNFYGTAVTVGVSPYCGIYSNYIYLRPSGVWSLLPHAGQIYEYAGARVMLTGAEFTSTINFSKRWSLNLVAEYVYTLDMDEKVPLSFSPPFRLTGSVRYSIGIIYLDAEYVFIARQSRIAHNEDPTDGAHIFNLSAGVGLPWVSEGAVLILSLSNIFDRKYFNHMSFYRKAGIPEPGRNAQIFLKLPFKK